MAKERTIAIPAPKNCEMVVMIEGITPLLCDRYGEHTMEILKEREKNPNQKNPKKPRDGEQEWRRGLYVIAETNGKPARYGFPGGGIMKALAMAGYRFVGTQSTVLYGALSVTEDLVEIRGSEPRRRDDPRAISGKRCSIVYRPEFVEWAMDVPVIYDADILTQETVLNLFSQAGTKVGIGNWRPEKKGTFGQWKVMGAKA